ncbi:MAG: ABC-F family ATP-binding cassette domain-containing protein [Bacillota bacterium]
MLLQLHNIHKAYGGNDVLRGVSLQLHRGERAGLVGINGAGKSTLLKIIIGEESADEGQLHLAREVKAGYLSQKPEYSSNATLRAFLEEGVGDLLVLKEEIASLEQEMAQTARQGDNSPRLAALMERYGTLTHRFEERGGYNLDHRLRAVARGLGFGEADLERSLSTFSGGEKTRAQLASLLLQEPELLLLDEPTNNLDAEAVEWLENYLSTWRGALLVVSHDRYFLNRVATAVVLLEKGVARTYRGNYSAYQSQRGQEEATALKSYRKQQAIMEKERAFILNAAADARTKRQARSREKRLEKMAPLEGITREREIKMKLGFAGRSGKLVVALENVSKAYGQQQVFAGVDLEIHWGDRVAVVGPNGAGKTTLLRIITGEETPNTGRVRVGPAVRIAYFDQEQRQLDFNSTPLATIMKASAMQEPEARNYLGRYLFQGDDVFKKIGELSGGEISRLALAKMGLVEGNFLIMDEPTNHLDIRGVEELETTLADYPGTLLLVSHDRYFISRTAGSILEIQHGRVRLFQGSYQEYREIKDHREIKDQEKAVSPASICPAAGEKAARYARQQQEKAKRAEMLAQRRRRREIKQRLDALEEEIHQAEGRVALLEERLADPSIYDRFAEARVVMDDLQASRRLIENLYDHWEKTAALLEELPSL